MSHTTFDRNESPKDNLLRHESRCTADLPTLSAALGRSVTGTHLKRAAQTLSQALAEVEFMQRWWWWWWGWDERRKVNSSQG